MFLEQRDGGAPVGPRPDACPQPTGGDEVPFIERFGLGGTTLVGAPTRNGDKCCYVTTSYCEGRPLLVHGEARVASLSRRHGWT